MGHEMGFSCFTKALLDSQSLLCFWLLLSHGCVARFLSFSSADSVTVNGRVRFSCKCEI